MPLTPHLPWPTRRTLVFGLAASLFFACYGSLVPFDLRGVPLADAWHRFEAVWTWPPQVWSRSDVVANVLLMMPVVFCAMGALRVDRRGRWQTIVAGLGTVIGGALCAAGLEFSQIYTPDRIVSQSDVLAQTVGAIAGMVAWVVAGQPVTDWLRGAIGGAHHVGYRRLHAWLALYAVGWLLMMTLPLDLSLSPAAIVRKYRAGNIVLVPFAGAYSSRADLVWDAVSSLLSALPLGALAALTMTAFERVGGVRRAAIAALAAGSAFVLGGEFVQLLVAERTADITDVLFGSAGMAVGVWLAFRHMDAAPAAAHARPSTMRSSTGAWLGACGWIVLLAFYHWKPFVFSTDLALARERVAHLSLMPLRQYQWEPGVQILTQALLKSALGVPLGLCLAPALRQRWTSIASGARLRWTACAGAAFAVFTVLEAGQVFLPERVPDITDVLLGCTGALVGFAIGNALAGDLQPAARRAASTLDA